MRVFCVLRSGGDYHSDDVERLQSALARYLPGHQLWCLSDIHVPWPCQRIALSNDWPGWWSKMSLFRPDLAGPIFYLDLDTVPVGDMSKIVKVGRDMMLSDFYFPLNPASGLMFMTEASRREVWKRWIADPKGHMARHRHGFEGRVGGDQGFLAETDFAKNAGRWQDVFPGEVISYKCDVKRFGIPPENAKIVCFHGNPRPKAVNEEWIAKAQLPGAECRQSAFS